MPSTQPEVRGQGIPVYTVYKGQLIRAQSTEGLLLSVTQSCPTLQPHGLQHTRLPCLSPSPEQTWVWVDSRSWWWTGRPGVLRSMGLKRVGHDWVNWTELSLLKLISIESVIPSKHLILCHPLLLLSSIFPSQGLFQQVGSLNQVAKYWSFSISPSNEYSRLISFRID